MKLEPKAKPVKIRIKSGGEEHSSLDSLKRNFSVEDLLPLQKDGRLSRWLRQLNENELADKVGEIDLTELTKDSYISFLRSFFEDFPEDISKMCDKWLGSSEYHKNGIRLLQYKLINDNNWNVDQIISLKDKYSKEIIVDWIDVFKKSIAECHDDNELFRIVKMFYENKDKEYTKIGQELLEKLESKGNTEAEEFLAHNCDVTVDEIERMKNLWNEFNMLKGFPDNLEKQLKGFHSLEAKATIGYIFCISNIVKQYSVKKEIFKIIRFKYDYVLFSDELLLIKLMMKNGKWGADGLFYPFNNGMSSVKNVRSEIFTSSTFYNKNPRLLVQIENGVYGNNIECIPLNSFLYDMAKYAVQDLSKYMDPSAETIVEESNESGAKAYTV